MTNRKLCIVTLVATLLGGVAAVRAADDSLAPAIEKLRGIGPNGAGNAAGLAAWKAISRAGVGQLPTILAGMKGVSPLADNWFRAAVEAVAERELGRGGKLPMAELEQFIGDVQQSPRARRLAFELIARLDPSAGERIIPGFLNDPSLELRRDAVAQLLASAAKAKEANQKAEAAAAYQRAFAAARDLDQIKTATDALQELGETADVPRQMGFLVQWHLIGPFDNTGGQGFDTAYPPEAAVDLAASHPGKSGPVKWIPHTTSEAYGTVDLNVVYNRPKKGEEFELTADHKGAITYAFAEFVAEQARPVELRIGCINANKVWLNGELMTANEVYHSNTEIDQYVARAQLRPGRNTILVKVAQNEQSEVWAQRWQFQLRICDEIGTAVLAANR